MKDYFKNKLKSVERNGVDKFLAFLINSDFFEAPASVSHHDSIKGGLAKHSRRVYEELVYLVDHAGVEVEEETLIICGLLHDVCKINVYVNDVEDATQAQISYLKSLVRKNSESLPEGFISKKYASDLIGWYKDGMKGDRPKYGESWIFDDPFPIGHGEKSVIVLQHFFKLTPEEALAIRYHMGAYGHHDSRSYSKAKEMYPLVDLLHLADMFSTIE